MVTPIGRQVWGAAAIDPGTTTGYASIQHNHMHGAIDLELMQFDMDEIGNIMDRMIRLGAKRRPPTIIYEKYVARPSRHGHLGAEANRQLSPVAVWGKIEGHLEAYYAPYNPEIGGKDGQMPQLVPQMPSEMAGMPDKRLKAMFPDLFRMTLNPAMPHARDALRHLLVYLKKHQNPIYQALKTPQTETAD
jgi:hypothetical protein